MTCGVVVVELRGFEPLTPCMPCHPHHLPQPSTALLGTASDVLSQDAGRGAVVRREAKCGVAADNLLTASVAAGMRLLQELRQQPPPIMTRGGGHQVVTPAA